MLKRELAVNRRKFVAGVGSVLAAPPLISAAQQPPIKLGQCVDFSGSIADLGKAIHQGAQLCFNSVNAAGGINGRQIVLDARDDGYDAKRSVAYAKEFAADPDVVALFNCVGTPAAQAILPIVHGAGIPFFAPLTGGLVARPPWREVFNIRPSYSAEAEQLVKHISTVGLRKIGIAQQNSVFGKEVLDGASAAATRYELPAPVVAQVESDGSNAAAAAEKFAASDVQAVVVGLAGAAATGFVKQMRLKRKGIQLYALSVLGAAGSIKGLGSDAIGLTISQVVPLPSKSAIPIVGEYLRAWNASKGNDGEPSHLGLEGYINARVMVEGLRRAGRNVTRGGLIESLWSLRRLDLGGFEIGFVKPGVDASDYVSLTLVSSSGKFIA